MRAGSVDQAFVAYVMHNVEEAVREAGIPIATRPMDSLSMQQKSYLSDIDLQTLYKLLYAAYEKPKALDRDILSLRIVISRRLGSSTTNFLKSKHLMLTRNALLRVQSKLFMEREKGVPLHRVPPAEHISRIAASLWLELGAPEKLSISRKQLVAACSRVAEARPEIIEKLHAALQRIVPEKAAQFETLISQPRMMRLAVDVMGGVERHITDKTALEAFDRLQEEMTSDAEKKAKLGERRLRERHREQLKAKETELVDLVDRLSRETQRRRESAEYSANAGMRNIRRLGYLASGVIAILGVGGALIFVDNVFAKYALAVAAAGFSVACYYGLSHRTLMQRVIARGGRRMDSRLRRAGLLAESEFLELRDGRVVVVERRTDELMFLPAGSEVTKSPR
jgi:hypothetical protein